MSRNTSGLDRRLVPEPRGRWAGRTKDTGGRTNDPEGRRTLSSWCDRTHLEVGDHTNQASSRRSTTGANGYKEGSLG